MSALNIRIPIGHAAHWKLSDDGSIKVEMLRFLTTGEAKARTDAPYNRKKAA